MKTLLRSTFVAGASDDRELLLRNVQALRDSGLGFDNPEDGAIWGYVQDFRDQYHHVPDATTLRNHFIQVRENEVVDRLDALAVVPPRTQGDFLRILEARAEDRRVRIVSEVLREAARIVDTGITIKEGRDERLLRGPASAIRYILDRGHEVIMPSTGLRLSGEVTADGEAFLKEYDRVESDPLAGIGQFSGIEQMDLALKGAKRGELWTHAAFTGGLKSTLALNWAYNQAVHYKHSSIFFSLEMPYQQVRRILYTLHSSHDKFSEIRKELGIGRCISYQRVRDGELDTYPAEVLEKMSEAQIEALVDGCRDPERPERKFLTEYVVPDFNDRANNYGSIHIEVADPDKSDFTVTDLKARSELIHSKDPQVSMIIADHAGLMSPRHRHRSTTENLNEVIRDLKRLAMSFNRGAGIAVVSLFQINREGYKNAEKNGGAYNLTHLSYANEAERSSDIVTAGWIDSELAKRGLVKVQCLKSRDDEPFADFYAGIVWDCRRLTTVHDVTPEAAKRAGDAIDSTGDEIGDLLMEGSP